MTVKTIFYLMAFVMFSGSPMFGGIVYSGSQGFLLNQIEGGGTEFARFSVGPVDNLMTFDSSGGLFTIGVRSGTHYSSVFVGDPFQVPNVVGFNRGDLIGEDLDWTTVTGREPLLRYDEEFAGFRGDFFNESEKFIALSIETDSDLFYGWIRASHSNQNEQLILEDWAWNSNAGEAIMAGAIPEPATVSLLIGGFSLAAVLFLRRRPLKMTGTGRPLNSEQDTHGENQEPQAP